MTQLEVHSLAEVNSLVEVACHHDILIPSVQFCCIWNIWNPLWGSLFCWLDAVMCNWGSTWGVQVVCDHHHHGWYGLLSACHGRLCPQVWSCRRLVLKHAGWQIGFTVMSDSSLEGVFKDLAISLSRSFPFMAVGMYNTVAQLVLLVFIIDHITAVYQCFDVCNKVLRVLSGLATTSSSLPSHIWVLMSCVIPCCILLRKAEAFALVALHSSSSPVGIHCACISRDLVPRAAKTYQRWSLLSVGMQLRRSQFSRVCQKMEKE